MSRRSRRRKRGAAAGDRAAQIDIDAQGLGLAPSAKPLSHRETSLNHRVKTLPIQPFPFLCVLDVEATCDEVTGFKNYEHEIIELPVVVIDLEQGGEVVAEFHTFVRPTINSTLTEFCTKLTGITQEQVDAAPTLAEALAQFEVWRLEHNLTYSADVKNFAFAADGPWDLRYFIHGECTRKGIAKADYFDKWCNVKQLFADFYHVRACKIHKMLQLQGMRFEGRLHSGIDDTRNIARIAAKMRRDGAVLYVNEALPQSMRAGGTLESSTRLASSAR